MVDHDLYRLTKELVIIYDLYAYLAKLVRTPSIVLIVIVLNY